MKISIVGTQEEFDAKRPDLIKAIAGSRYDVTIRKKGERTSEDRAEPFFVAQAEMLDHWDGKFRDTLNAIKREINEIIG